MDPSKRCCANQKCQIEFPFHLCKSTSLLAIVQLSFNIDHNKAQKRSQSSTTSAVYGAFLTPRLPLAGPMGG